MYIGNSICTFSGKLLLKRTGILGTFVTRGFSNFIKPHDEN